MQHRQHIKTACGAHEIDGGRETTQQDTPGFPEHRRIDQRRFHSPFNGRVQLKKEFDSKPRLLRFIPCRSLPGFSLGARLNMQPTQDRRILANNCSRTSVHGRPAWGLARNSASRSSRIRRCSLGTGTHSGLSAMRSQSSWTNAIRCSLGASSNSRGTFRFALIGSDYRPVLSNDTTTRTASNRDIRQ